ncbi:hypothetical protein BC937DRAFT_93879 [Endogone sp. FLAS-F59071]|nr:hypothetical protein BC937DRAFT_93879 [Endogone sp. FLAS-F59071]|eukprot:RUS14400.1 hypothetical protein BC937DRAFT_93879 [Endogone sp. FLAS-F59071]
MLRTSLIERLAPLLSTPAKRATPLASFSLSRQPLASSARPLMSTNVNTLVSPQVVEPRVLAKEPLQDADAKWIGLHRISYVDPHNKQRSATEPTRTLLVIQFRPALGKKCVEFPAGLIDDEETPEQAAVRELQEETGYHGLVSYASSVVYNDPGLTNANMKLVVVEARFETYVQFPCLMIFSSLHQVNMDDDRNRHPVPQLEDGEFIAAQIVPLEGLVERFDEMNQLGYAVDARLFHLAKGLAMARGLGL